MGGGGRLAFRFRFPNRLRSIGFMRHNPRRNPQVRLTSAPLSAPFIFKVKVQDSDLRSFTFALKVRILEAAQPCSVVPALEYEI